MLEIALLLAALSAMSAFSLKATHVNAYPAFGPGWPLKE
jgi:hypothetical protein